MNETILAVMELLEGSDMTYRVLYDSETGSYTITVKEKAN